MPAPPRTLVIVNPSSAGGRTLRHWPAIRAALRDAAVEVTAHLTVGPGDATTRTRKALRQGFRRVVAVGGDGTLNEVVNGFFDESGTPLARTATVAMFPSGTGADFQRTLGLAHDPRSNAMLLAAGTTRQIDVGRIEFGSGPLRHFVNVADCGIGGEVVARVNRGHYKAGGLRGSAVMLTTSILTLMTYGSRDAVITVDGEAIHRRVQQVVIANGRYYGGGMHIAPQARPDDGLFDVIIVAAISRLKALRAVPKLYRGRHLDLAAVELRQAKRVTVEPGGPGETLLFDVEGEQVGQAPATLTILPGALRFAAPAAAEPSTR